MLNKLWRSFFTSLGDVALVLFCTLPGLIFSYKSVQEPWTLFRIARVTLSLSNQHIAQFATSAAGYRAEHIGGEMVQTALLNLSAWPLEWLGLVPIGSLLIALVYYGVALGLSHSRWTAGATAIFATWYYPTLYSDYGTQTYVWVNAMFIVFLLLVRYWLTSRSPLVSILLMLVFIATFWHYQTTPIWMIAVVSAAVLAVWVQTRNPARVAVSKSWSLPLFCLVLYFGFDTVTYQNGVGRITSGLTVEFLTQSIWSKVLAPLLFGRIADIVPYTTAAISPRVATYSTLAVLILLTLPVVAWVGAKIYRSIRGRALNVLVTSSDDVLVWAVVIAATTHTLIYLSYGAFSPRLVPLAFPVILPLVLNHFRRFRWVSRAVVSSLALLAIIGFASYAPSLVSDVLASETGSAPALIAPNGKVLGDATVYGDIQLEQAKEGKLSDLVWIDSANYGAVVGEKPLTADLFDYAAIDKRGKPLTSSGWISFQPWTDYLVQISNNTRLNQVYESDKLILLQRPGLPLGTDPSAPPVNPDREPSFVERALRLFLAVVLITVLPGLPIVWILRAKEEELRLDVRSLMAIGVTTSISFATFIGYIVNFTSLGLGSFIPMLSGLVILLMVGALWYLRHVRAVMSSLPHILAVLTLVFVWAFLSTAVAQARTRDHAAYTEFFLTQSGTANCVDFHVVNRVGRASQFYVNIMIGGVKTESRGPHSLVPYARWTETVCQAGQNSLSLTLERDNKPAGALRWSPPTH